MKTNLKLKSQLMEMFPKLTETQAESLISTGDDINIIITRILDNNIEGPVLEIKDLIAAPVFTESPKPVYNYPEVFDGGNGVDMHQDVRVLRSKAAAINERVRLLKMQAVSHEIKSSRTYFSIEADNLKEEADALNRTAAAITMKRSLDAGGPIDLHGLTVAEVLKFMDDLHRFSRFKSAVFITGKKFNSQKIRPAVEKWLVEHGYSIKEEGPCIHAYFRSEF